MKKWILTAGLCICWMLVAEGQVVPKVKRSATNKTANEISKKVNKGIDGLFNGKKKKKKKKKASEEEPIEKTAQTTTPPDNSPVSPSKKAADYSTNKSDFVPGERIIFWDTLANELPGEFPSRWDWSSGTIENGQFGEDNVISFVSSGATIMPLMSEESYLPDPFTVEAMVYFHNKGNEGYYFNFKGGLSIRVNIQGTHALGTRMDDRTIPNEPGWRQVAISYHKGALKAYLEGKRLINIPRIKQRPTALAISALSHSSRTGQPAMIKNIRIAEGGVPLYKRLITDGKLVVNAIQFDYNKATIRPASMPIINRVTEMLQTHPEINISIEGHTDSDGSNSFNQNLSEQRAQTVKEAIIQRGIAANRLSIKGWGEEKPLDPHHTPEAKQQNRRVEFVLIK